MNGYLTEHERIAVRLAGQLSTYIAEKVCGHGPARDQDIAELEAAVHVIQRMVLAQAAARAYPDQLRLLGETIESGSQ